MTLRRRFIDYGLSAVLLVIPALILHASFKDPAGLSGFDRAVLRVSSPLQAATSFVIETFGGVWSRYVWLVDVDDENRELRDHVERLQSELATAQRRAVDAELLEEMVALKEKTPADILSARVVSAGVNPWFRVMRISIDRGAREVGEGMPVITARGGLVGRIERVYGDYADVLLVTDAASSVDVYIARTGGRGVVAGLGRDDSYACKIDWLDRGSEDKLVKVDDLVVTSGLGSAFPAGIPVGHVARVTTKEYSMFQAVEVDPVVDFGSLRTVMVLTAPAPPPDPDAGKKKRAEPAHGTRPY